MKTLLKFHGVASESPSDGFWYGFDRKLKTKLIAMSLALAIAIFAVAYFLFHEIDIFPVFLPWALALLAYIWPLNVAKKRHTGPNGSN